MIPSFFEQEKDAIFYKTWQFACHESEIAEKGAYISFEIANQSLFCVRGKDMAIRCFYNVCQHRAHQLVAGKGKASVISCPYHAWSYELTGQLRSGPNLKSVEGFR